MKIYENTIGKSMVFDGLKPWKSIETQTLFLILGHSKKQWKIDAKMAPKSHEQLSKMERGGALDRFILRFYRFWKKAKKLDFSMRFRGDQKQGKSTRGAPKARKSPPANNEWTDRSPGGSRHSRLGINNPQPVGDHTRQRAEGPANFFWAESGSQPGN